MARLRRRRGARPDRHHGDRGGGGRAGGDGDGGRERRALRPRPAPPAPRPGGAGRAAVALRRAPRARCRRRAGGGSRSSPPPPTASPSPRPTSRSAGRGSCSAPARPGFPTFRAADLVRDQEWLLRARADARELLPRLGETGLRRPPRPGRAAGREPLPGASAAGEPGRWQELQFAAMRFENLILGIGARRPPSRWRRPDLSATTPGRGSPALEPHLTLAVGTAMAVLFPHLWVPDLSAGDRPRAPARPSRRGRGGRDRGRSPPCRRSPGRAVGRWSPSAPPRRRCWPCSSAAPPPTPRDRRRRLHAALFWVSPRPPGRRPSPSSGGRCALNASLFAASRSAGGGRDRVGGGPSRPGCSGVSSDVRRRPAAAPVSRGPTGDGAENRPLGHAFDGEDPPRPLLRGDQELGRSSGPLPLLLLRRRLARPDQRLRRPLAGGRPHPGGGGRLDRRRPRPRALGDLHPVDGPRARRAAPAAVDDHPARLAGAGAHLQGADPRDRGQGPGHLRLPRLPGAADGRHHRLPRRLRAGGGGPGQPPRAVARDRPPLQHLLRRRLPRAAGAVHRQPAGARYRRPQDVEVVRQRHQHRRSAGGHPQEVHGDVHRPAAAAAQRPRPARGLQPLRVPPAAVAPRAARAGGAGVPGRRDRLRRRQEADRRGADRLPGADAPAARGAGARQGDPARHPRGGLGAGAGARRRDPGAGASRRSASTTGGRRGSPRRPVRGGDERRTGGRRPAARVLAGPPAGLRGSARPAAPPDQDRRGGDHRHPGGGDLRPVPRVSAA